MGLSTSSPNASLFSIKRLHLREVEGTRAPGYPHISACSKHVNLQKEEVSSEAQPLGKRVTKQGILVPG